jgi:HSP20 family protein
MTTFKSYDKDCTVYPGQFVPLVKEDDLKAYQDRVPEKDIVHPPVNMTEEENTIRIDLAMPGIKREELLIVTNGNLLSAYVIHHENTGDGPSKLQLHESGPGHIDSHIQLPENVDAEFICAEYRSGILHIYIPKTTRPINNHHTCIAVY